MSVTAQYLRNRWFFILILITPLWGQNTAEVKGRVRNEKQQPVVSAFVLITEHATSSMRAATTDEKGEFSFPSLPVGSYGLEIKAEGYNSLFAVNIRASIGSVVRLDVLLAPQGSKSSLANSEASLIETENAQLGVVVGAYEIENLPLKSHDAFDLLQLQPGVQSALGADLFFGGDQPGVVSVSGGRARSNNYNVNGGTSGDQMVNYPTIEPSIDSISEFRVISHNYDALSGRNSGSILNLITKSGGSRLHADAYEFLRNNVLNAKGYFDPKTPDFKQNEFGGAFGGPIRPDKTFFFGSYEGRRIIRGISSDPVTVPTSSERSGDFSLGSVFTGVIQSAAVAQQLNSRTGCASAVGSRGGAPIARGTSYSAIFPGNRIPTECFDPTGKDLLEQFVPLPNLGGNVYQTTANSRDRNDRVSMRLDENVTGQQQLSLYYYGSDGYDTEPFSTFQGLGAALPGFGDLTRDRFQQVNLSHSWTVSAKTINESRFIYYRNGQRALLSPMRTNLVHDSCKAVPASACFSDPSNPSLGITSNLGPQFEGVPFVDLSGGFSYGNNWGGNFSQTGNIYEAADIFSKLAGNHSLKAGVDWRDQRLHQLYFYNVNGSFSFVGGGPNDVGFSSLIPNYLLGLPDGYIQGSGNAVDVRSTQFDVFAQDGWKIKRTAALDYGVRWEWNQPQVDAGNRIQAFRPGEVTHQFGCVLGSSNPLIGTFGGSDCSPSGAGYSVFPLGLVFPGDPGVPEGLTHQYWRSFAPRLGLALTPSWKDGWLGTISGRGKLSIRAGWGIFYDSDEEMLFGENLTAQPPFGGSTVVGNIFFNTPFLSQDGSVRPNPFHGFLNPKPGSPVDFAVFRPITLYGNLPSQLRSQYSEHYHFTLQREIAKSAVFQIGYVGSEGHRQVATVDQNYGLAQPCLDLNQIPGMSCGPFQADSSYDIPAGAIPSGVTLHLPYGSVSSVTGPNPAAITLVGLRKYSSPSCEPTIGSGCPPDRIPVFGSIFSTQPVSNSAYNSLQMLVSRHLSHGLQFLTSYTWSKSFDSASSFEEEVNPISPSRSRSLSLFDARQRLVFSGNWQIPSLPTSNWVRHAVNGWALSSILTLQSGFPIRITSTNDLELMSSYAYQSAGEPEQVAPMRRLHPESSDGYFFSPSSFLNGPIGQIGNAHRTVCCGPGIANLDLGVHKAFSLSERLNIEFRTEIFNILNKTQFFNPDGNIADGTQFGEVSRARDPRLVQLGVRVSF